MEKWLERIPFLQMEGFDFIEQYKSAVAKMLDREMSIINSSSISDNDKAIRTKDD